MKGKCDICLQVKKVMEFVTVQELMDNLKRHEHGNFYVCADCKSLVIEAIKQAIGTIRKAVKAFSQV